MIFIDRGRRAGPGRFTRLKVHLFFAGAAVLLAGMALQRDALVLFAIAILAVGILLRMLERRRAREYEDEYERADVDDVEGDAVDGDPPADCPPPGPGEELRREDHRPH